jgi:drug/metabolite transporter (DMT)-like permease
VGLGLAGVVLSSALQNCTPIFILVIALIFRLEEVRIGERHGQAKILGVLLCVLGAMALLFYKGPNLLPRMGLTNATLPQRAPPLSGEVFAELLQQWGISKWQIGALCIIGSSLSLAVYINLQVCFLSLAWVSECNPICSRGYKFESILSTLDMLQQNYVNKNHII